MLKDFFRWLTRQNVILHNPASELELPRMEKRLPQEVLTLAEVGTAAGRARRDRPAGRARPGHAGTVLLDGHPPHRTLPPGTARPEHRTAHAPRPSGQGQERPRGARGRAGRRTGWNATCRKCARVCAWTRARRRCSSPATARPSIPTWSAAWCRPGCEQAGLKRKGCCHVLRHTCATHMLENGADIRFIQQLLGHEKLDTTAIYTEVSIKQLQEVHARCHPSAKAGGAAKSASTAPAKSVIWRRGCKRAKLLHFFSCWPGVSRPATCYFRSTPGLPATPNFHRSFAPPPKNSRRGFSRQPIGSPFTAKPWPLNKHAGFEGCGYKTASGRHEWPNHDPDKEDGGLNLYGFVANNPINRIDAEGLCGSMDGALTPEGAEILAEELGDQNAVEAAKQAAARAVARLALATAVATTTSFNPGPKDPCKGLRDQLNAHIQKLVDYIHDPDAHDNLDLLKNRPDLREKLIDGRIRSLQKQIDNFRRQLQACEAANRSQ